MPKRITNKALRQQIEALTKAVGVLTGQQKVLTSSPQLEEKPRGNGYLPPKNVQPKPKEASVKRVERAAQGSKVELWSYNEYNDGGIIASGTSLEDLSLKGKKYVSEANVENALTLEEKNNQWEAYFPEIWKDGAADPNAYYAGNKSNGKAYYYVRGEDGSWTKELLPKDVEVRFYLGQINRGRVKDDWYLSDIKGNEITDFKHQSLERKTVVFIKIVGK